MATVATMAKIEDIERQQFWRGIKKDYFAGPVSTAATLVSAAFLLTVAWTLFDWGVLHATVAADARMAECRAAGGACWSVITNRWRIILFGLYPYSEHWRSALAFVVVIMTMILSCMPVFWHARRLAALWIGGFLGFYILMHGGLFGLPVVGEEQWGGLSLTLFVFVSVALIGMPLSIILALLRNSKLPVISKTTGILIDGVRSLPLVSILFVFAIVLPFSLPDFLVGEKLYRVIFGAALFFSAYQAEIVRGGMQGVAKGQEEAAMALGLGYWHRISRIQLPQAFRNALPATINQFVVTFKETSLIVIIGFFELLASSNAAYGTAEWSFAFIEVYVFTSAIYFAFVFSLSRYGAFLERRMSIGTR